MLGCFLVSAHFEKNFAFEAVLADWGAHPTLASFFDPVEGAVVVPTLAGQVR